MKRSLFVKYLLVMAYICRLNVLTVLTLFQKLNLYFVSSLDDMHDLHHVL